MRKLSFSQQKAKIIFAYNEQSGTLFARVDGVLVRDKHGNLLRAGNSWAASFWAGYDGITFGPKVSPCGTTAHPFYAAGKAIRRKRALESQKTKVYIK